MSDLNHTRIIPGKQPVNQYTEKTLEPHRFEIMSLTHLLSRRHHGDGDYLVDGLLHAEGASILYGLPQCGKTLLAMDLALHVALGWPWRGLPVKAGAVVYVALEAPPAFRNRVSYWFDFFVAQSTDWVEQKLAKRQVRRKSQGFPYRDYSSFDVFEIAPQLFQECERQHWPVRSPIPFHTITADLNLVADGDPLITSITEALGPNDKKAPADRLRLIVLDTLGQSFTGDENSAAEVGDYIKACRKLQSAFGAQVLVLHHEGKESGRGERGSSKLRGDFDASLHLRQIPEDKRLCLEVKKLQGAPLGAKIWSKLHVFDETTPEDGRMRSKVVLLPADPSTHQAETTKGLSRMTREESAMAVLTELLAEHGQTNGAQVPHVKEAKWRRELRERKTISATKDDSRQRQAYRDVCKALVERGVIEVSDGMVAFTGVGTDFGGGDAA